MKTVYYVLIVAIFLLVTFFGLGPVILADGSKAERALTLAVVIIIYILLGWITYRLIKKK